jgi:putative transposase
MPAKWGGQAILGEEGFVGRLADHLRKRAQVPEISKDHRYAAATRPAPEKIFSTGVLKDRPRRNQKIAQAVEKYGSTQRAIADHLGMHFTYVSQIMKR